MDWNFNFLAKAAYKLAAEKGWWDKPEYNFPERIALMHSEVTEAFEDFESGRRIDEIYFEGTKPCGIPIELADLVIRIGDLAGRENMDMDKALRTCEFKETLAGKYAAKGSYGIDMGARFPMLLNKLHKHLSRALEHYRKGEDIHLIYSGSDIPYHNIPDKASGVPVEFARAVMICEAIGDEWGFDIGETVEKKHEYNKTRSYRHGNKLA